KDTLWQVPGSKRTATMSGLRRILSRLAALTLLAPPALLAQWPEHPDPAGPSTADAHPDLDAPPPTTTDGKHDLRGVWQGVRSAGNASQATADGPPVAGFLNVAQNIDDGLPLTPSAAALLEERRAGNGKDNPEAHCLPMGIMQFHTQGAPRKIVQTPGLIVILYEASMGIRQIFLDGRSLPDGDPQPWWYGYSVGHWEGDT